MCFSLQWFGNFLIWLIIICVVIALLRLLVNFVLPKIGIGAEILAFVVQAFTIIMWGVICVAAVFFIIELVSCVTSGGFGLRLMH